MRPSAELRNDHEALRATLARLEGWLPFASAAPFTIQRVARSIASRVHAHVDTEDLFLAALREILHERPDDPTRQLVTEYQHQREVVLVLLELLIKCHDCPVDQLVVCASNAIAGLQQQLAVEEERLFPVIDQLLSEGVGHQALARVRQAGKHHSREPHRSAPIMQPDPAVTAEMTVEHVLSLQPDAQEIFRTFGVNAEADRACRLFGLEWRRNVDVDALVLALNQAMGDRRGAIPVPHLLWKSCDGMMLIDNQRRILAMNPALEQLSGRRTQDVAGRRACGALLACQDRHGCSLFAQPDTCPGLKAMRRLKPIHAAEYTIVTATGRSVPVSASYTPIRANPTVPAWALVIMRNNAVQKRRERRLSHHTTVEALIAKADERVFRIRPILPLKSH